MSKPPPSEAFREALKTKGGARLILEAIGIEAEYVLTITDSGPGVEIRVPQNQYGMAMQALPFTIGGATVKIVKKTK
jgi:hypothetical protein